MKGFMLSLVVLGLLALCCLVMPDRTQDLASAGVDQQISQEVGLFGRGTVVVQRRSRQRVVAPHQQALILQPQAIVVPHQFVPQQQLIIVR